MTINPEVKSLLLAEYHSRMTAMREMGWNVFVDPKHPERVYGKDTEGSRFECKVKYEVVEASNGSTYYTILSSMRALDSTADQVDAFAPMVTVTETKGGTFSIF